MYISCRCFVYLLYMFFYFGNVKAIKDPSVEWECLGRKLAVYAWLSNTVCVSLYIMVFLILSLILVFILNQWIKVCTMFKTFLNYVWMNKAIKDLPCIWWIEEMPFPFASSW